MQCESQNMGNPLPKNDDGCINIYVDGDVRKSNGHNEKDNKAKELDKLNEFSSNKDVDGDISNENEKNDSKKEMNELCPPCVGMEFETHENAYNFYNQYAGHMGFSIRRYSTSKSPRTKEIAYRRFSCSLEGFRNVSRKSFEERKRNQFNLRTGCMARMTVKKKGDKWIVSQVVEEHNHKLASPSNRHKLRSLKKITKSQEQVFENMHLTGVEMNLMMSYMALKAGGSRHIGFTERDERNLSSTKRQKELIKGDAEAILDYFQFQQMESSSFFYSIQVDSDGQMTNFFWADARSRMDYYHFGEVVIVDPTFGTDKYGLPFVPIFGINHHYQIVLFGTALLYTESEESLMWVIKTWMRAMNGKQPKVILTDEETAIGGAIKRVLPGTHHRYCLWHIIRTAMKNLPHSTYVDQSFIHGFNSCIYGSQTVKEFESNWEALLKRYDLEHDSWFIKIFEKREKWASVYTRDVFCASVYTTQCSESLNSYFEGYLERKMTLSSFLKQYKRTVDDRREAENDENFETNHKPRILRFSMDIEKQAANVYTRASFQKFQIELLEGISYRHKRLEEVGSNSIYHVWKVGHEQMIHTVSFNSSDTSAKCSCRLFDFAGYLCRHILKVFIVLDVQNLPTQYILRRWTRDAKCGTVVDHHGDQMQSYLNEIVTVRYSKLCQEAVNIAVKGATSIEAYRVAMDALSKALKEVEAVMRNVISCHMEHDKGVGNEHTDKVGQGSSKNCSDTNRPLLDSPVAVVRHKGCPRRIPSSTSKQPHGKKCTGQKTHKETFCSVSRENSGTMSNTMPPVNQPRKKIIGQNKSPIVVTTDMPGSSQIEGCDFVNLVSGGHHLNCSSSTSDLGFGILSQGTYISNLHPSLDVTPNHQVYHLNQESSLVGQHTVSPVISVISRSDFIQQRHSGDVGIHQSRQENTLANVLIDHRHEGDFIDLNNSNQFEGHFHPWS